MNIKYLQDILEQDDCQKNLVDEIVLPSAKIIELKNLKNSALAFSAAQIWKSQTHNHLFIFEDYEKAAYFLNDFEQLTHGLDICYFPDSFRKNNNFQELNNSHVMLRAEAIMKFQSENEAHRKVLVSYPDAIFEKVVNADNFVKNSIFIKKNEKLDIPFLKEFLIELGFEKEEFVYEPGQFAIRGGIVDIYSFGNDKPYRIELFDDEVNTIRIFDPETQLSERKLLQVRIVPNVESHFSASQRLSLLEFLPQNTVIWIENTSVLFAEFERLNENLLKTFNSNIASEDEENFKIEIENFVTIDELKTLLNNRLILDLSCGSASEMLEKHAETKIEFDFKQQLVFNRNFDLMIQHFKEKIAEQYQLFIFSENPKQLERLNSIFEDLKAQIIFTPIPFAISSGFVNHKQKILCYTDHQIFQRYHKYKVKQAYSKGKALTLRALKELTPGDFVAHIDHGVGMYSGLQKIDMNGVQQEAIRIIYKDNDVLYVNINSLHKISKFTGKDGTAPKIHKIGSGVWEKLKDKTKKQVKDIAAELIKLYAERKANEGFQFSPDNYLQNELEASFIYEDTPDQFKATEDVKNDMQKPNPMDRLVCGDVGFGKTEVAIRAAFKAVCDSKQVAILVPTTVLAYQHYQNIKERLNDFPCTVDYLNRFKTTKEKKETLLKLGEGKIDIIVGTHALLGKDIKYKDLGLLVIDEEQKFGVGAKEKIRQLKTNVDTLTLTATPIPRTLQFSLMGARDLSIINTAPPNRQPVETKVAVFNDEMIREALYFETNRGGQLFFVHNRIKGLAEMKAQLLNLCPDISIGMAHGQMDGNELEETILDFMTNKYDVLLCTNIIESGIDIPNANTIIVNNAHQFGLSDLHQLRGRVGRSNKKAFCYFLAPPLSLLPNESKKRLQTLEEYSELGSGFQIAMRDLDIRGAGNMLGGEQSGFIADIGFDTYQKILNEAIRDLKHHEFKDVFKEQILEKEDFVSDCTVDTDIEIVIPDTYVESIQERLSLYTQLDNCENETSLQEFISSLIDRFGPIPSSVEDLFKALRCRWAAKELGFEKLILKNKQLRLYFISNPESPYFESETFKHILDFIQSQMKNARLKNMGKIFMLVADGIKNLDEVLFYLKGMKHN
ncbi:MAG: transcription-repair coupling factor [Chitinophagaceae bacterium]|nr:transcription-repair coupling factor [Chitinophagaceae bacterium]